MSGVSSSVPPRRLLALPSEDTVTSIASPGRANGGSTAVTITAATFFNWMFDSDDCELLEPAAWLLIEMPRFASMLASVCVVNGVCVVWSPVPSRPTTRP